LLNRGYNWASYVIILKPSSLNVPSPHPTPQPNTLGMARYQALKSQKPYFHISLYKSHIYKHNSNIQEITCYTSDAERTTLICSGRFNVVFINYHLWTLTTAASSWETRHKSAATSSPHAQNLFLRDAQQSIHVGLRLPNAIPWEILIIHFEWRFATFDSTSGMSNPFHPRLNHSVLTILITIRMTIMKVLAVLTVCVLDHPQTKYPVCYQFRQQQ